jgi:hypothetical protein
VDFGDAADVVVGPAAAAAERRPENDVGVAVGSIFM